MNAIPGSCRRNAGFAALTALLAAGLFPSERVEAAQDPPARDARFQFDRSISRQVLENYISRAITMEGLLNGRGDRGL
jgi:hypothetical protein